MIFNSPIDDGETNSEEDKAESDAESEIQPLDSRTELMLRLILDRKMFMKQISVMKLGEDLSKFILILNFMTELDKRQRAHIVNDLISI